MGITSSLSIARNRIRNNSFAAQFSLTLGTNVIQAVTGMATGLLAARLLGPQGRGELAAIQSWVFLIGSLATLGMAESVVYFSGRFPDKAGRYLMSAQLLDTLPAAFAIVSGWVLMPWLLNAQSQEIVTSARVFLVMMVPIFTTFAWYESLRSANAWRPWNFLRILPNLIWALILVVAFVMPALASPATLSLVYPVVFLFQIIPAIMAVRRRFAPPFRSQKDLLLPLLKYGLPTVLTVLPRTLNLRLDQLLMAMFFEPKTLGLYVAAVAWATAPALAAVAVGQVLFPRLSAIHDVHGQSAMLRQVLQYAVPGLIAVYIILGIVTPIGFPLLFGVDYQPAVPVALVLVLANCFYALNSILSSALYGLGFPKHVFTSEFVGLGITAVGLVFLLPRFGAMGAAITSSLAYLFVCCALILALRRVTRFPMRGRQPSQ
jgi:O-antigen/teichoic acid export membrane protein